MPNDQALSVNTTTIVSCQFLLATMVSYSTLECGLFSSKRAHDPLRPNFVCTYIMPIMLIKDELVQMLAPVFQLLILR